MNEMINIGLKVLEDIEHAGYSLSDNEGCFSGRDICRVSEIINKATGYNEMLKALKSLTDLMDEIDHSVDGDQTDRVFAEFEFDKAREVLKKYGGDK